MEKDFDGWNEVKKRTNQGKNAPYFHEREIWWCSIGINIGTEEDGSGQVFRRPVLVLKKLSGNSCFVVPLTASRRVHPMRIVVGMVGGKSATALLSQVRVLDTKRFGDKVGYLDIKVFEMIRKSIKDML